MQNINFAKRAKKLRPDLNAFIIEQKFTINEQGYFVSRIWMWLHINNYCSFGVGETKIEAWENLIEAVEREMPKCQ